MSLNILIVGTGAIGAFYGSLLAHQGCQVTVCCRSDYQAVKQHGITIHSSVFGECSFHPYQVISSVAQFQGEADYLLLCTKVLPDLDRCHLIREAVSQKTAIVLIQNGIDIEQEILTAFPDNTLISGLAFICCFRSTPNLIQHTAYGKLTLGDFPNGVSKATEQLVTIFNASDIDCIAVSDIIRARWQKNVWNAPFNPLSVLSGGLNTLEILQQQESLVRQIMQEICDITEKLGYQLARDTIDTNINSTYAIQPYKTSMLLDFERNRPMETEAILGNALRTAKSLNFCTPHLETLYGTMKLIEYKQQKSAIKSL